MSRARAYKIFAGTFSPINLKHVYLNKISDSKAVGRDGIRQKTFEKIVDEEISIISSKVLSGRYSFTRYKERLVSKGPTSPPRVLSVPTFRDRLTLRALCDLLAQVIPEASIELPHFYIRQIKDAISASKSKLTFVRVDVQQYYPSINIELLMRRIRKRIRKKEVLKLINSAIETPTLGKDKSGTGVPQGLSISNVLANYYLIGADKKLKQKWEYFRYVDDILIITSEDKALAAFNCVSAEFKKLGLVCHPIDTVKSKSQIKPADQGIDYLGFNINTKRISIRLSSYKKMFATIMNLFTEHKYRKNESRLIWKLNLKVSGCIYNGKRYGWMNFFSQTEDIVQLARLDFFVRKNAKRLGIKDPENRIKRFVKAYHEIRFNFGNTRYVPNFDLFTETDMAETVAQLNGEAIEVVMNQNTAEEIEISFWSLIKRQVSTLEKDLIQSVS